MTEVDEALKELHLALVYIVEALNCDDLDGAQQIARHAGQSAIERVQRVPLGAGRDEERRNIIAFMRQGGSKSPQGFWYAWDRGMAAYGEAWANALESRIDKR